ncbi:MAG: GNAT family N-acetyltransferase [Cellulomonadaceae bacterium]
MDRTESYVLRAPRLQDAPEIAATHVQAWRETYPGILSAELLANLDVAQHTRMWENVAASGADPARRATIVLDDQGVCGFGLAGPPRDPDPPRDLELYAIYLLERAKGAGVGRRLTEALLGGRPALVWVADRNARAQRFYARRGFRRDGASKTIERWDNVLDVRMVRDAVDPGPPDPVG